MLSYKLQASNDFTLLAKFYPIQILKNLASTRKVKSYLLNINITTDEEVLQRMSLEIEPTQVSQL